MSDSNSTEPTRHAPPPDTAGPIMRPSEPPETEESHEAAGPAPTALDKTPGREADTPLPLPVIPGYAILEEIGRGGMGVVYKARQLALNRLVALKVILAGAHADKTQLARFYGEARAVARLRHPHIVQIYEVGEHNGLPYFSLELIEGGSLARRIARQPQPPAVAAHLVEQLARAVHFAHAQGVIHRDLKPANILLEKEDSGSVKEEKDTARLSGSSFSQHPSSLHAKITDFGLAKSLENEAQTHSSAVLGTPSYMSPEQACGASANVGPATDQYALGAILYDLLTGRPPFKGTTLLDTLDQVQTREPVPPSQLQANLPGDLETICLKCLQKDPRKRYENALALADDLRRYQEGVAIVARPVGDIERALRWARRNPRVAALAGAIALLLLALAGVSWFFTAALFHAKGEADSNARAAADQTIIALKAKGEAEEHARAALKAKGEADANARTAAEQAYLAVEALSALVGKAQTLLEDAPNSLRLRQELLALALQQFEKVERSSSPGLTDRSLAAAHLKMGEIYLLTNRKDKALEHYTKGRDLTAALLAAEPGSDRALGNHAVFLSTFGDWSRNQDKDIAKARDYYERALKLQMDALNVTGAGAVLTPAEKKMSAARTHDQLGTLAFNQGNTDANNDEAQQHFAKALALRESAFDAEPTDEARRMLAQSHFFLGAVDMRRPNADDALQHYEQAQTHRRQVYEANRQSFKARADLADVDDRIGQLRMAKKDYEGAQRSYAESLKVRREMAAADTGNWGLQRRLSQACYLVGAAAQANDDKTAAKAALEECVRLRRDYAREKPDDLNAHVELMKACARAGDTTEAVRIAEEVVRPRAPKDFRAAAQIACCYSLCIDAVAAEEDKAKYAAKGVEALQQARALGYKDTKAIDTEPDLEPLRRRAEFVDYRKTLPK